MKISEIISETWSKKYKDSIDCNNPKGFSQRAHCQGRKKKVSENSFDDFKKSFNNAVRGAKSQVEADTAIAKARGIFKFSIGDLIINPSTGKVYEIQEVYVYRNIPKYTLKSADTIASAKSELVDKNFVKINSSGDLSEAFRKS